MDQCAYHPDHVAIENCEVCDRPLCALCLWYGADGRRLCEIHAKEIEESGDEIHSPAVYAEALQNTLTVQATQHDGDDGKATYKGNSQDINSLLSAVLALTAVFSCCGGVYCLPIIALALGAIAYVNADKAFDPARTRRLAGIGLGTGAVMILAVFACIGIYVAFLAVAVLSSPRP
jgi:hypothetical protein